jgi:hypothetical protein
MTVKKLNCWELMRCGREPGGENAVKLGVCPAAVDHRFTGTNDGENAGRYCWRVAGTLCNGEVQGTFAEKALTCCKCEFFLLVVDEEGPAVEL